MSKPIYLDKNYSIEERAADLVSQMTVEERAAQLKYNAPALDRLGIPEYNWWNEGLHGVARAGLATMFPQAIGMAAMFDEELLKEVAEVIATEGRAKYNEFSAQNDRDIYKGLTYWSPNINIFRDPRWGRGHETYGEDPYLTARLGVNFIKGLQGDGKYMKLAACAKHFAVHSGPEAGRHSFNALVSKKDMFETYLPAFEAAVKEAKVESVMGAYNRTNGEPCCGSKTLLHDILREKWGFKGHVVSDCWAIVDFHKYHMITKTAPESAALAINNGCDLNCGVTYLHLLQALQDGLITEDAITTAATRLMETRLKLGMFSDDCEFDEIPYEKTDCKEHNDLALKVSQRSMVMLKNDGILPLDKSKIKNIAVIGPNADSEIALKGNYFGTASRYYTVLDGIYNAVGDDVKVTYSEGCHLFKDKVENLSGYAGDRTAEAISLAKRADVVVLCLGLDSTVEGEDGDEGNGYPAGDKADLKLPGIQNELLEKVVATKTPVILALMSGSAMDLKFADENCAAIIDLWYPGNHGGTAFADIIFGKVSPSGKLPVTFYKDTNDLPDFEDYSMENRTYRYMQSESLYSFGFGLSYSNVDITNLVCADSINKGENLEITIDVTNTGKYDVNEVVQCYIKDLKSKYAVKNHSLAAFKTVALASGETKKVSLTIDSARFNVVNENGEYLIDSDSFKIYVGTSQPDSRSVQLMGKKPIEKDIQVK